jgi:DNA-binding GntR family transcriptional regulator
MTELSRAGGIPVYVRIRETLRDEITKGILKRGEQLPPEHELAAKLASAA